MLSGASNLAVNGEGRTFRRGEVRTSTSYRWAAMMWFKKKIFPDWNIAFVAVGAAAFLASAASADEYFISYKFDGDYIGNVEVSHGVSDPSCAPLQLQHVEIRNGILRAYNQYGFQTVKGFVTGSGFFNSDYYFDDGRAAVFEGLVDRSGSFTGGIVDSGCYWVVALSKSGSNVGY